MVVSTAIRDANPELVEAHRRGLRVLRRAAALAAVMAGRRGIAIAGTHGKTTTTSMLVTVARRRAAPTRRTRSAASSAELRASNAADGTGELFVAEADESDGSFLLLSPYAAVVTNVEADHLDQHGTAEAVAVVFEQFARRIDPDGFLVVLRRRPGRRPRWPRARRRRRPARPRRTGVDGGADLRLTELRPTARPARAGGRARRRRGC